MQAHTINEPRDQDHKAKDRRITGIILVAIGLTALAGQFSISACGLSPFWR
ncbi:MAG: hypothetical protein HC822_10100 [Oscillochloris sp.]|nr:hypothetical protein [Oscillochloris sp.]